jgi:hypothetical protein
MELQRSYSLEGALEPNFGTRPVASSLHFGNQHLTRRRLMTARPRVCVNPKLAWAPFSALAHPGRSCARVACLLPLIEIDAP